MARNAQKRARGGRAYYSGGTSGTAKEAAAGSNRFKKGGKVCAMDDKKSMKRIDKFARGGKVNMSSAGGGSADKSPFSSAKRG